MRPLRALLLPVAVALATTADAQGAQSRLVRDAEVRATPDGNIVATLQSGTTWRTGTSRSGFTQVTIEAWIDGSRFAGRRESFPESIGGTGTLRIRAEPSLNGRILGVFEPGAGVRVLERRGTWARITRDAWILTSAISPAQAVAATQRQGAVQADSSADAEPTAAGRRADLRASRAATLHRAPGAAAVGRVEEGAVMESLARDRGWVRVRVEAWVPESLVVPTDSGFREAVTAADLRLDPDGFRGRTVRWVVQVVGLQTADPLRRDLEPEEPYLLAMGPAGENAVLYLAVPPALMVQARGLAPMAEVLVTARVRTGRSMPTGAPVLDLLTITKR